MTLNDLLKTRYVRHGRVAPALDCWGLTRLARVHLFGKSMLPSFVGVDPADKLGLTRAAIIVRDAGGFAQCGVHAGAIATAWCARVCVHVGIVVQADSRLWVLETEEGTGPVLTGLRLFASRYSKVVFYDD